MIFQEGGPISIQKYFRAPFRVLFSIAPALLFISSEEEAEYWALEASVIDLGTFFFTFGSIRGIKSHK